MGRLLKDWEAGSKATHIAATDLAGLYALVGDKEKALTLLERDSREGNKTLFYVYQFEWFDSIRDDPRFEELLRRLNIPTAVTWHPSTARKNGQL